MMKNVFLWCHVSHINLMKMHPKRITQEDKKLANDHNYDGIEFPVREKDFSMIEKRTIFVLMCFLRKTN